MHVGKSGSELVTGRLGVALGIAMSAGTVGPAVAAWRWGATTTSSGVTVVGATMMVAVVGAVAAVAAIVAVVVAGPEG